jgi:glycosyltransferase involved in cell wall biosynthesis
MQIDSTLCPHPQQPELSSSSDPPSSPIQPNRHPGKVCYIYQDQYPWEVRVEKIINSLAYAHIETHLVSRNRTGLPCLEKLGASLFVHRLPDGIRGHLRDFFNFPAFFSPFWFKAISRTVRDYNLDLIIVRDLPLAPTAYAVGKITRTPVLMDMAEDYPAMTQDTWDIAGPRLVDYLIRNPYLLKRLEEFIVPRLSGLLVVSPASRSRIIDLICPSQLPIWIVNNTPRLSIDNKLQAHPLAQEVGAFEGLKLLYIGGLERSRGLDIAIRAIPLIKEHLSDVRLTIVGTGGSIDYLQQIVKDMQIQQHVVFPGWVDYRYVPSLISATDIGIIPHYVTPHTSTTIPNKLFDYMAQSKPVLATNCPSLVEIVSATQCGRIYCERDPSDLAQKALELADPEVRSQLGKAGYNAIRDKYNWESDARVLIEAVRHYLR